MDINIDSSCPVILQAKQVSKTVYSGGKPLSILHNIDLSINLGSTLTILGASGAGKSTLLGLLAGLDLPTQGDVMFGQYSLTSLDEDQRALLRAQHVGFIFQTFQLLHNLTALENVMLPLELLEDTTAKERSIDSLQQVGLADRLMHYPAQLSGGEQQRVAIARAFAVKPSVLFADEPTGNLDQRTAGCVIDLLFKLNERHSTTLIIVTHDENLSKRTAHCVCLDKGRLQHGS